MIWHKAGGRALEDRSGSCRRSQWISESGANAFVGMAKTQGDAVEWWNGFTHYDRAYLSKVFTFTPDFEYTVNAGWCHNEVESGGEMR